MTLDHAGALVPATVSYVSAGNRARLRRSRI